MFKEKNSLFLGVFILLAVLNLWATASDNAALNLYTKPLLMPALALWMVFGVPTAPAYQRFTALSALGFSTAGDVLLLFSNGDHGAVFFLLGLGAFLFAHLFYSGLFLGIKNLKNGYLRFHPLALIPFVLYLSGFLVWLWPGIPREFRLPVALYGSVITCMALCAFNLRNGIAARVHTPLFLGALLFVLSDSLIAVNKFREPFEGAGLAIMLTYLGGQFLLVRGIRQALGK